MEHKFCEISPAELSLAKFINKKILVLNSFKDVNDLRSSVSLFHVFCRSISEGVKTRSGCIDAFLDPRWLRSVFLI